MDALPYGVIAALIGLCTGIVLGLAARLGEFCTLGAIESAAYGGDQRRLRQWGVVLGTAIFSTFLLADAGLIDLQATIYHSIQWNPLASIAGGLRRDSKAGRFHHRLRSVLRLPDAVR